MSPRHAVIAVLAALVAAGCTPHRVDIRQGNFITQELVDQVEVGMTREQVRFLLGTPLVASPFRADRWDYVYYLQSRYIDDDRGYLVVWFDDDVVERLEVRERPRRQR